MTTRELVALSLLVLPFLGLAVLWIWWVRGVPAQLRADVAKRQAALALPIDLPLSIYMSKGGLEYLVFQVGFVVVLLGVGATFTLVLLCGYVLTSKELLGLGVLFGWATCAGLWKYARIRNRQAALYLSSEGLQAFAGTRLLWRDIETVAGSEESFGAGVNRGVRHTLTLTLRPGGEVRVKREGGLLLRWMLYHVKLPSGREALTLDVTHLEDWATVQVLLELVRKRIDADKIRSNAWLASP